MSAAVPVCTDLPAYQVAVAELPGAARATPEASGAVVVVAGSGRWWSAVEKAAEAGARAVVVDEPAPASAAEYKRVRATGLPLVVSRARLRPDVVSDATAGRNGAAPRAVSVDAGASEGELAVMLRDAVGWARVLSGALLRVAGSRSNSRGISALLEAELQDGRHASAPGPVCTLAIAAVQLDPVAGWLRVDALAEVRTEILIDSALGGSLVATSTVAGRLESPRRYETVERLALRRALAAVHDAAPLADLADIAHDDGVASTLLRP